MKKTPTLRTLQVLALEKEIRQSHIAKKINRDSRTVLRHLQELEKDGLARVKDRKRSEHGKPQNIWEITSLGLVKILSEETIYEHIDEVARTHSNLLPLVFGKWNFFEKIGVKKTVIEHIKLASRIMTSNPLWTLRIHRFEEMKRDQAEREKREKEMKQITKKIFGDNQTYSILKQHQNIIKDATSTLAIDIPIREFVSMIFVPPTAKGIIAKRNELADFLSKLHEDPEIKGFFDEEFQDQLKEHEEHVKKIRTWRDWWTSLEKKAS